MGTAAPQRRSGFFEAQDGLRWAAGYGLVRSVWRNGPIEDAHASRPTGRRKALHDGTISRASPACASRAAAHSDEAMRQQHPEL